MAATAYTSHTGAAANIAAAVASMARDCTTYPAASTRSRGRRSPREAAGAAMSAAGTSWMSATTPTDVGPVSSYAYSRTAIQVPNSAMLKAR